MNNQMLTSHYRDWGVREKLDHRHNWFVYPQELPPLPPGHRYVELRTKDERVQAEWDAERAANDAKGYHVAHCPDCGITRVRVNDESKAALEAEVGLLVGDDEMAKFLMSKYGNPYERQVFRG